MSLKVKLFKNFELDNPIMVASSHLTESVNAIKNWQIIQPSAITIKTTSNLGGTGRGRRYIYTIKQKGSLYCNGDKEKELLNYTTSAELLTIAKNLLPNSKIGSSILMGENYKKCLKLLKISDFFELNLKYSVRINESYYDIHSKFQTDKLQFEKICKEIEIFLNTFIDYPCFIKLTREIGWLRNCQEFKKLIDILHKNHFKVGIIIANTKKHIIPPSSSGLVSDLEGGIISGSLLFEETYKILKEIYQIIPKEIPIIATGGIDGIEPMIDVFKIGAKAVQICTIFHLQGFQYYYHLTRQLNYAMTQLRTNSFEDFLEKCQNLQILRLPSPYTYYQNFYYYPFFKSLFNAKLLDILIVYGRTFTRENQENFISRFSQPMKTTRIITMAPASPCLKATARTKGRKLSDMREKIKESHKNWINLYKNYGYKDHLFEIYQHSKIPFHSGYITENNALFVPYSMLAEGRLPLPIYEFDASTSEYLRLKMEFDNLIKESKLIFSSSSIS